MDAVTIDLPHSLDIAMITSYFEDISQITAELSDNSNVIINAQALAKTDTAGLQLLVALFVELARRKINVSWSNTSDELVDNALHLGLLEILKLD